jgi:hypothetical protein
VSLILSFRRTYPGFNSLDMYHPSNMLFSPSVGFKVIIAVTVMSTVVWNVTPCGPVEVHDVSENRTVSIFRVEK